MTSDSEAQSEAPSVDTLKQVLATLFSDGRSIGHTRAVTAKEWEQIIGSAEAKINRLIVEAELKGFNIAFDCHDYDRLRAYKEQLTKELGDSEAEKNSGTWSRV